MMQHCDEVKKILYKSLFLTMCCIALLFSACGNTTCGGTETGNPSCTGVSTDGEGTSNDGETSGDDTDSGDGSDGEADPSAANNYPTGELISELCAVVRNCYDDFVQSDCEEFIESDENALESFGVDIGVYATFTDMQDAYDAGDVEVDASTVTECLDSLEALSCSTITADNAYIDGSDDYNRVFVIVPSVCLQVF